MYHVDEQIAECIDQLARPKMAERREQGHPDRFWMTLQLMHFFNRHAAVVSLNNAKRELIEEMLREFEAQQEGQLAQLFFQGLNADWTGIRPKIV
jgi:hypothetical protein